MKKIFLTFAVVGISAVATAQKTPPRPHHPPHPSQRGDFPAPPEAPPKPLSPKEVWQKIKQGKKKADAKREEDLKTFEAEAAKSSKNRK